MWLIRTLNNVVRLYNSQPIQSMKFRKLTGVLLIGFYCKLNTSINIEPNGIVQEKDSEKIATIHWQSKTIERLDNNTFEAEAYAARLTSEECNWWKAIVVEVCLRYRFEKFTVLTDSKSVKVTVDAPKFNKDVKLSRRDFAMVRSLIQFEGIRFHFVPTQMMIADCLTKAMSGKDLHGVLEDGMLRLIDLTSDYSIKAARLYALVASLNKELDENYDYGYLSPNEQDQFHRTNPRQTTSDPTSGNKERNQKGTLQPENKTVTKKTTDKKL